MTFLSFSKSRRVAYTAVPTTEGERGFIATRTEAGTAEDDFDIPEHGNADEEQQLLLGVPVPAAQRRRPARGSSLVLTALLFATLALMAGLAVGDIAVGRTVMREIERAVVAQPGAENFHVRAALAAQSEERGPVLHSAVLESLDDTGGTATVEATADLTAARAYWLARLFFPVRVVADVSVHVLGPDGADVGELVKLHSRSDVRWSGATSSAVRFDVPDPAGAGRFLNELVAASQDLAAPPRSVRVRTQIDAEVSLFSRWHVKAVRTRPFEFDVAVPPLPPLPSGGNDDAAALLELIEGGSGSSSSLLRLEAVLRVQNALSLISRARGRTSVAVRYEGVPLVTLAVPLALQQGAQNVSVLAEVALPTPAHEAKLARMASYFLRGPPGGNVSYPSREAFPQCHLPDDIAGTIEISGGDSDHAWLRLLGEQISVSVPIPQHPLEAIKGLKVVKRKYRLTRPYTLPAQALIANPLPLAMEATQFAASAFYNTTRLALIELPKESTIRLASNATSWTPIIPVQVDNVKTALGKVWELLRDGWDMGVCGVVGIRIGELQVRGIQLVVAVKARLDATGGTVVF